MSGIVPPVLFDVLLFDTPGSFEANRPAGGKFGLESRHKALRWASYALDGLKEPPPSGGVWIAALCVAQNKSWRRVLMTEVGDGG